jgi:hypothetical protein
LTACSTSHSFHRGIPILYGTDADHNNIYGAIVFPHNVSLGDGLTTCDAAPD